MRLSDRSKLKIVQVVNILVSLVIVIFVIIFFIGLPTSISKIIVNIYLIGFAVILVLAELKVSKVQDQLVFLKQFLGRGLFIIFLGTLTLNGMNLRSVFGIVFITVGILESVLHQKLEQLNQQQPQQQI